MGVRKNFIYSSILTVSNYVFPLITYPYVSRVLGVTNIGICNFVDSIIHYFILFSMMGISATGIREVSASRNNQNKLDATFTSLLLLNSIFTIAAFVILIVLTFSVPKFVEYKLLFFIGAAKLLANAFQFEWLYKGLEDFKYITQRSLLVKSVYVVAVFLFVHKADDYPIYFLLLSLMVVVNATINVLYSKRYIHINLNGIRIKPYINSFLTVGIYLILTSFYTSFNVAFLGFVTNPTEVGYYTTATKLFSIIIAFFTAFTGVMLPRMSALRSERKMKEFMNLTKKSIGVLISLAVPAILLCVTFAPDIIKLFAGKGYEGAFLPTRIIIPLIFIIGYEQILVVQILMPLRKDKAILYNSLAGAAVGVALNIIFVSAYKAVGTSIVWLTSEIIVMLISSWWVNKFIDIKFPWRVLRQNVAVYFPLGIVVLLLYLHLNLNTFARLSITSLIVCAYVISVQVVYLKDEVLLNILNRLKSHIIK